MRVHQSHRALPRPRLAELPALTIVDLAYGTGSTLRACTTSALQNWKLVDNDLTRWCVPPTRCIPTHGNDPVRDLEAALDGPLDLVAASALLDLVS